MNREHWKILVEIRFYPIKRITFVCRFVCPIAYLKNHVSKFDEILCTCYVWPWLGLPWQQSCQFNMLCTFGFIDDIMGHMQIQVWIVRRSEFFTLTRQVALLNYASRVEVCFRWLVVENVLNVFSFLIRTYLSVFYSWLFFSKIIDRVKWRHVTYPWSQYDRHFVGQDRRTVRS